MPSKKPAVNPRTNSVGVDQRLVQVLDIPVGGTIAITADRNGYQVTVPIFHQRSKAPLPQVGENWLISQDTGSWKFSMFMGTSTTDFSSQPGEINGADIIPGTVGTDQLAEAAVTAAQLANAAVTSAALAEAAVNAAALANGAVLGPNIAAGAVTTNAIAANAIVAGLIAAGAIDGMVITSAIFRNVAGGSFLYSAAPALSDLIGSWASTSGTDAFGNPYPAGLSVGSESGPQVILSPSANITVKMQMPATNASPSDITSFSNLQQIIEFPSNNANETAPPIMGETLITYTTGATADCLLILGGMSDTLGIGSSMFQLFVSQNSTGTKQAAIIHGAYIYTGSTTVTLFPQWVEDTNSGSLDFYNTQSGPQMLQQTGTLIPPIETWVDFSPMATGWSVAGSYSTAAVRLLASPRNSIQFDALLNTSGSNAADGDLVGNVPSRFRPSQTKTFPVATDVLRISSGSNDEGARFTLDGSGNLRCFGIAAGATQVSLTGVILPLDSN